MRWNCHIQNGHHVLQKQIYTSLVHHIDVTLFCVLIYIILQKPDPMLQSVACHFWSVHGQTVSHSMIETDIFLDYPLCRSFLRVAAIHLSLPFAVSSPSLPC